MNDFVSLPEAARRADVSATTVRRWLNTNKIKAEKNHEGEWEISLNELKCFLATAQPNRRSTLSPPLKTTGVPSANSSNEREAYSMALKTINEALERERHLNDILTQQNQKLTEEIFKLHQEIRAYFSENPGLQPSRHGANKIQKEKIKTEIITTNPEKPWVHELK